MEPFSSSSSYMLGQLPDYVNLWSRPPPPQLTRPASPPRRNAASLNDARMQNYLGDLQYNASLRAAYHHSIGGYLPSRAGSSSSYDIDADMGSSRGNASMLASTSGSLSADMIVSPRARRAHHRGYPGTSDYHPWRGEWKEEVKLREAIESGGVWSGSGVTDEEEKALTHEENLDLDMRAALVSYGRTTLTILGRGRTMQEEHAEMEDREAYASNFPAAAGVAGAAVPAAGLAGPGAGIPPIMRGGATGPDARSGAESRASANPRVGTRADGTGRAVSGSARTDQGEGGHGARGEDEGNVNPHAGQDVRARGLNDNGMDEEDAVFEGEYTLDDGRDDEIIDAYPDGGGDGGGHGSNLHGHQGGGDFELDLDAGIQNMD